MKTDMRSLFRAAGNIVNGRRDTLYYTAVLAYSVVALYGQNLDLRIPATAVILREAARSYSWWHGGDVNRYPPGIDPAKNGLAAMCASLACMCVAALVNLPHESKGNNIFLFGLLAVGAALYAQRVRKYGFPFREIPALYRDVMFDYPRKRRAFENNGPR